MDECAQDVGGDVGGNYAAPHWRALILMADDIVGIIATNAWRWPNMYIVMMAWLYVTLLMSLTLSSALAGVAFFLFLGVAPMLLFATLALLRHRRLREQRARQSVREQKIDAANDHKAEPD